MTANKTSHPVDLDLTDVVLPNLIPTFDKWNPKQSTLYWNCDYWWDDVIENRRVTFDCMAYTASWLKLKKCRRLICAKLQGEPLRGDKVVVRQAANIHTKLYIVKGVGLSDINEVWVGSCNLVSSKSWHNVMVRLGEQDAESLKLYFKRVWELCE